MCVVSMVHDHYQPIIPMVDPWVSPPSIDLTAVAPPAPPKEQLEVDLKLLIAEFREALAAAKKVDMLTKQPDCADPEKLKLEERVCQLEALLASGVEFVLAKGAQLEPGRYRVIDGKLFKQAVE